MAWTLTGSPDEYLAVAGGFLRSDPVRNTIALSVADTVRIRGLAAFGEIEPLFGGWRAGGGEITAALLHTPPFPVLLTGLPQGSGRPLAEALIARGRPVRGVNAQDRIATAFAGVWAGLTGAAAREFLRTRLYWLRQLRPPEPAPGGVARRATAADRGFLAPWLAAFADELGDDVGRDGDELIDDQLSYGGLIVWESGGTPVSLAGMHRPSAATFRIGPVYTPPGHRRRGYGGAVTAAVCRAALDAGAQNVVLFTDQANPASNSLYQRLGFEPVEERVVLHFIP
ncbi:MAG TPA: GNAT family N-acetyltransferase [Streptosporangiaceae bacterium]|nr:GNAT family N-acetyltransferase [Streptosporangiaceae bacterium]